MNRPAALLASAAAASALLLAAPARAETAGSADAAMDLIADRVAAALDEHHVPGAAAAVVSGDATATGAWGDAVAGEDPFTADTAYYTGSVAKLFTTAAALQLVGTGALDLDADVNDHLEFQVPDTYPGEPVTLRNLLTHTSGFEDRIAGWSRWEPGTQPSLAEFAQTQLPERLREPGALVTYDNYDMVLAGVLIEAASGQSYEDYVTEHVFAPLGMDASRIVLDEPAKDAATAEGYRYADGQIPTEGRISPATPAGPGVLTSAEDMGRFMTAVLDRDPALGEGVAEQMTTRQFGVDDRMPGMGFSFQEYAGPGGGVWFKDGDVPGYHSALAVVPDRGVAVSVAFNGDGDDAATVVHAAERIVHDVLAELGALPRTPAAEPAADDLDAYTGEYVSTRTTRSDFTELSRVFAPVTVAAEDGGLRTTGLSADPATSEQHWIPLGEGLFQEREGTATIAFTDGVLLSSSNPTVAYEPVPLYDGALVHQAGLGFGALVLAAGFLALTVLAIVRAAKRGPRRPALRTAAAVAAWLLGGTALAVLGLLMTAVSDSNLLLQQVVTGSATLTAAFALGTAAVALTAVLAGLFTATAIRRQWTARTAVSQALMLTGGAAFSAVLLALNLTAV